MSTLVTTIGLEIHVELKTATKLFCGCPVSFGGEPNTRVCQVCLGHPGTLPVPNERAIEFASKIALALNCTIAPRSVFHRKNYFYPDMPKNYQISQYDIPIGSDGGMEVEVGGETSKVGITRVHLEEDTGKSIHVGGGGRIHEADYSLEDFNRAGTPLVEIVTEPDITSAEQARIFATELRTLLGYLGVSDVRMEEGSMRVDANISVAPSGERGTKVEVKNMNSLRSVERALIFEQKRQSESIGRGESLDQSTRHWDEEAGKTSALRTKEQAFDYRYFPEPDLVPIEPSVEWLRQLREEIPELPSARRRRFGSEFGLGEKVAGLLSASSVIAEFFESAVDASKESKPDRLANWISNELLGLAASRGEGIGEIKITAADVAQLVDAVAKAEISGAQGKLVLERMLETGSSSEEIIAAEGLSQVSDAATLDGIVDQVVASNQEVAERVTAGEDKPVGFLMGEVMKASKGQANPKMVREILLKRLRP